MPTSAAKNEVKGRIVSGPIYRTKKLTHKDSASKRECTIILGNKL
jgi:hypothetical protein